MRALKALVIGMGMLIVAGMVVVAVTIANRAADTAGEAGSGFGATRLELPPGSRIADTAAAGDRLVLRLVLRDGATALVVVDLATGRRLGTISVVEDGIDTAPAR